MSADNGIYIAKFTDGYRVIHAQAIENIDYYKEGSPEWLQTLRDYFGRSKVFPTHEDATKEAFRLEAEILSDPYCPVLEYGINSVGVFEFPLGETKLDPEDEKIGGTDPD